MPRLNHVKRARKARPEYGIEIGDSYYWWQFAFRPPQYSKERPSRSQLTQSSYLAALYDLQDGFDESVSGMPFSEARDYVRDELDSIMNDCQESLDNMPDHLQESSPAAILLSERIEALENAIDSLDSLDDPADDENDEIDYEPIAEILNELE